MSDPSHREHIHQVFLNAVHYVGVSKLMAKLECSKSAAVLYALNEGLFKEGAIIREDYDLLVKRYGRTLKEVIAQVQVKKEPSHVSVLNIEQRKEKAVLEGNDKVFQGMIQQWDDHKDAKWRSKIVEYAKKFEDKSQSARDLLALAKKMESAI